MKAREGENQLMTISTLNSHIYDAIKIQSQASSAYMVIGKTSPWTNESNPDVEVNTTSSLTEVAGYKKVSQFSLARPLASGETTDYPTVTFNGVNYALIPVADAYDQGARWIYAEAFINYTDFPNVSSYRQVGLHLGLVPKNGVTKQNLLPTEVSNPGILRLFTNKEATNLTPSQSAYEQAVIMV